MEVVYNPEHELNVEKFVSQSELGQRLFAEANGDISKVSQKIRSDPLIQSQYQGFLTNNHHLAQLTKFIRSNQVGLNEADTKHKTDEEKRAYIAKAGKQADFDRFCASEDKKIDVLQFINSDKNLKEGFKKDLLSNRMQSAEHFITSNANMSGKLAEFVNNKIEANLGVDFILGNEAAKNKYLEAKKKSKNITVKEFLAQSTDLSLAKEFVDFKKDKNKQKFNELKQKEQSKLIEEFGKRSKQMKTEYEEMKKKDSTIKLSYREFIRKKVETGQVSKDLENLKEELRKEKETLEFLDKNPELKAQLLKTKPNADAADARAFLQTNKTAQKKFDDYRAANIDRLGLRKFVETSPEMQALLEEFKQQHPDQQDIGYEEWLEQDDKARELYDMEVVYNPEHELNVEKFILQTEGGKKLLEEANGDIGKVLAKINKSADTKKQYDTFLRKAQEVVKMNKFIASLAPEAKKQFEADTKHKTDEEKRAYIAKAGKQADFDRFCASEDKKIDVLQFINSDKTLKDKVKKALGQAGAQTRLTEVMRDQLPEHKTQFEQFLTKKQTDKETLEFLDKNPELKAQLLKTKPNADAADARAFLQTNKTAQKKFDDYRASLLSSSLLTQYFSTSSQMQSLYSDYVHLHPENPHISLDDWIKLDEQALHLWESDVILNPDHESNIQKFLQANDAARKFVSQHKGHPRDILIKDSQLWLQYQIFFRSHANHYQEQTSKLKSKTASTAPLVLSLPLDKALNRRLEGQDQEYVEEFLLSNRDLRDSFVEAKKLDEKLTPEQFLRQAGANVNRQFKKHEIALQRKSTINNFLLSNQDSKQKFEESRKKHPTLTEEQFLKNNEEVLTQYQNFVKKLDFDKSVDRYLKQNRAVEDLFIQYQRQTGNSDFQSFIKVAPKDIQVNFNNYLSHEESVKELHDALDENPDLKQTFLKAKTVNRDLNDLQLLERDSELREAYERAKAKKIQEESVFQNFILDTPEIRKEYDEFKKLHINAGMKEFLDYNPELINSFKLYSKNEDKMKQDFKQIVSKDAQLNKAFDQYVLNSKQNIKTLQKMVEDNPRYNSKYEDFLKNSENSKVNYTAFIRSNAELSAQFENERAKNKNLTYKAFVEDNLANRQQYASFLSSNIKTDPNLIESFFIQNPSLRKDLVDAISKDPSFLYKEFLGSSESAQQKYREHIKQAAVAKPKEKTLMGEFLKKSDSSKLKFEQFKSSSQLVENKNIFKAFINNDPVRKNRFIEFSKSDTEAKSLFQEHQKKHPNSTFEEFIRTNLFQNVALNRRFLAVSKENKRDFDQFVKEDEAVIREFVDLHQEVKKEMNSFINNNQKAKLEYEVFIKHNPQSQLTFQEYLSEHPELVDDDHNEDVYNAFLSENKPLLKAFLEEVSKNPDRNLTAKDFINENEVAQKEFKKFATDEVIQEIKNIEEFTNNSKDVQDLIPKFIEQNEKEALNILFMHPEIRRLITDARKKNPAESLFAILNTNESLKRMCIEKIKEDKSAVRKIIKGNSGLKAKYVGFVDDMRKQDQDFVSFIKNNDQIKQIFNNMKKDNQHITFDTFLKEARKNNTIREMYVKDTLYNPDNNLTYEIFLQNDLDLKLEYEKYLKNPANPKIEYSKFVQRLKNDSKLIDKYKIFVSKNPTQKNFIREFIDTDTEAKNKFHQFIREFVEEDKNYLKFIESNKDLKDGWDSFQAKNPKATLKAYVNKSAMLKAKYVTFIRDHPETLEQFVAVQADIGQNYKEFLIKARDDAHFEDFLFRSPEVRKEFENMQAKNPKSKIQFDEFVKDFKTKEASRELYKKHKQNNTIEVLKSAISNKQAGKERAPLLQEYEFRDTLYSFAGIENREEEPTNTKNEDSPKILKGAYGPNPLKNAPINQDFMDQSSVGSNVLNSPVTGLRGEDFSDYNGNHQDLKALGRMASDQDKRQNLNYSAYSRSLLI